MRNVKDGMWWNYVRVLRLAGLRLHTLTFLSVAGGFAASAELPAAAGSTACWYMHNRNE